MSDDVPEGPVTEFTISYFGLASLERKALLDLYADHAFKFTQRHGLDTPSVASRTWATFKRWEGEDLEALIHRHRRLVSDMWHCACGVKINNEADHTNHVANMVREGQGS